MKSLPCFLKKEVNWGSYDKAIEFHKKTLDLCRKLVGYEDDPEWECPYYRSHNEGVAKFGRLNIDGSEWRKATEEEEDEDLENGIYLHNTKRWLWHPGECFMCERCAILAARHNAGVDGVSDCGYGECDTCSIHKSLEHIRQHARYDVRGLWSDVEKGEEVRTIPTSRYMFLVTLPKCD